MTREVLIAYLHRRKAAFGTWRAFAKHLGVSPQHLHDIKESQRYPSKTLLAALGLEEVTLYRKVKP